MSISENYGEELDFNEIARLLRDIWDKLPNSARIIYEEKSEKLRVESISQ
jgi:hypothetical protein